jgi:hypothetical protein
MAQCEHSTAQQRNAYGQLDRTSRSIRLLILSPHLHPEDSRIQCRLFITSLDSFPTYDALSYTWANQIISILKFGSMEF